MYFSNAGATVNSIPLLWANIGTVNFFEQFSMDGVDEKCDEIWLTFSPEQLSNALNVFKYAIKSIKIKLTKKQFPCLTIDIEVVRPKHGNHTIRTFNKLIFFFFFWFSFQISANSGTSRSLAHDVPVTLIPTREWNDYQLPILPKFEVNKRYV